MLTVSPTYANILKYYVQEMPKAHFYGTDTVITGGGIKILLCPQPPQKKPKQIINLPVTSSNLKR